MVKRMSGVVALAGVVCACGADVEPGTGSGTEPTAAAAIEARGAEWERAARAGDGSALASLYTTDAVLLPPGAPPVRGRQEIERVFEAQFSGLDAVEVEFTTDELEVAGDLAYRVGRYEARVRRDAGSVTLRARDKFVEIWRRDDGGGWRIARDIWNSSAPPDTVDAAGAEGM